MSTPDDDATTKTDVDEDHVDNDGSEDDSEGHGAQFVVWLEEGATTLSVGELHFASSDHTDSEEIAEEDYCVVYQLRLLPPDEEAETESEEAPFVYSFDGGNPFRVLPMRPCIPLDDEDLVPVLSEEDAAKLKETDDDDDGFVSIAIKNYLIDAEVHQSILEDLNNISSTNTSNNKDEDEDEDGNEFPVVPYLKVAPDWKFSTPVTDSQVVDGVRSWCEAGVAKTGWDLSKIPDACNTTLEMLSGGNGDGDSKDNVLLRLYNDLCAKGFDADVDVETIEDRFVWRTNLCMFLSWAVPNAKALQTLVDLQKPILEMGAGTGYWAWLLSQRGVDVAAYDLPDSQSGQKHRFRHSIVKDGSIEQVKAPENADRVLVVCWPDYVGDSTQDDADRGDFGVETLKAYQGDTVVHIGELESTGVAAAAEGWGNPFPPGGSSTSAGFQKELVANFELKETVHLPNWPPYNSHMTVWTRK
eukprot:CAMPEP_0172382996 /NCGR_PEP_ID=MMETSP1061-20121228/925_1 /TAXON_ID=37318 /ORGANISM="Pseudo-nitzschia pungens, Strain cf. pungens" /LENGTH=470 /DNA_ID=CAMNT_0013111087 /DNA_START=140 /DNA_END=1555 /DNA_ORIENTATION=+